MDDVADRRHCCCSNVANWIGFSGRKEKISKQTVCWWIAPRPRAPFAAWVLLNTDTFDWLGSDTIITLNRDAIDQPRHGKTLQFLRRDDWGLLGHATTVLCPSIFVRRHFYWTIHASRTCPRHPSPNRSQHYTASTFLSSTFLWQLWQIWTDFNSSLLFRSEKKRNVCSMSFKIEIKNKEKV